MSRPKKVLLVDDDRNTLRLLQEVAQREFGAEVLLSETISDARILIEKHPDLYGAILDVKLTNGNGIQLYRYIAPSRPKLNVVFLTGYNSPEVQSEIHAIGPALICDKPNFMRVDFLIQLFSQMGLGTR